MTLGHVSDLMRRMPYLSKYFEPGRHMLVQFAEFLFGQRTRVVDDRAINGDLSDVVQVTGYADVFEILTRDTHFPCNRFSVSRYSIRVAARVGIVQVDLRANRSKRIA